MVSRRDQAFGTTAMGTADADEGNGLDGAGGGGSGLMALWNSFVIPDEAFLNSLIPWPRPLANSGILLAPNKTKTAAKTITSSPPPRPNIAKHVFIKRNLQIFSTSYFNHQEFHPCALVQARGSVSFRSGCAAPCASTRGRIGCFGERVQCVEELRALAGEETIGGKGRNGSRGA